MNMSDLRKLIGITALILVPSIVMAGGTNSETQDKASTGQVNDPDPGLKSGDMGLQGVGQSSNPSAADIVDDSTLSKQVKKALKADPMLKDLDIKAEIRNGVVTLNGVASDVRWKARAETVASSVTGVKSVTNNITIGTN